MPAGAPPWLIRHTVDGSEGAVTYPIVVDSSYDGDSQTVWAVLADNLSPDVTAFRVVQLKTRLDGIDTPELNAPDPAVRERARAARDRLRELCPDGTVTVMGDRGLEKYGRTLARVAVDAGDVADVLVREGHGVPYQGGRR